AGGGSGTGGAAAGSARSATEASGSTGTAGGIAGGLTASGSRVARTRNRGRGRRQSATSLILASGLRRQQTPRRRAVEDVGVSRRDLTTPGETFAFRRCRGERIDAVARGASDDRAARCGDRPRRTLGGPLGRLGLGFVEFSI